MTSPSPAAEPGFAVHRVAAVRLRGSAGPLQGRIYWPAPSPPLGRWALLVFFPAGGGFEAADRLCRGLCSQAGVVVLAPAYRATPDRSYAAAFDDASTAAQWAADHAVELGADPDRLLVGGEGLGGRLAAAVALQARHDGWPPLSRQVLIRPQLDERPTSSLAGVAPATVVTGSDDGLGYADELRQAGVVVEEMRYDDQALGHERMLVDLAESLRRALGGNWG